MLRDKSAVSKGRTPAWEKPLVEVAAMAPARLKALEAEGVVSAGDLLRHYPRRHEDRTRFPAFAVAPPESPVCLRGVVAETKMIRFGRRCQFLLTLAAESGGATIRCRWFNLRYLPKILQVGQDLVVHGRLRAMKKGGLVMDHPDFEVLEKDAPDSELIHLERIAPIHPSLGPWSPRALRRLVFEVLARLDKDGTPAPDELRAIHFPSSAEELESARSSLARGELFEMQCVLARQRSRQVSGTAPVIRRDAPVLAKFVKQLPFPLTAAQRRVLGQIFDDLGRGHPMNRLLHGDVGSGKTIVAATAMVGVLAAGHSAALMAPTQVLAHQHFENLSRLFEPLGIDVVLRTAARKVKTPAAGPHVVIGTHALLFSPDTVGHPALVVIDEQHKFGVRQRAKLSSSEPHPHVLVMSATPIPRTLALTLYGDLDLSLLDEMPPGRTPVRTLVRPHGKLPEAADFLREQLDAGRQAYLVYPVIEEGKRKELKAATAEFAKWENLLAPHRCALLHGRIGAEEKESIMSGFRAGDIRALISTTVIEVGVDVANATVLLVENAERFGLAQLHQLRGRVGRGKKKSWCVLLAGKEAEEKLDRLRILEKASDGFAIAEADLEQRGPGDLLGTDQTGLPPVRLASLPRDLSLLEQARAEAQKLIGADPELRSRPDLQSRLALWEKRLFAGVA
jgi:ATP-dependent DNA helicase RecG